MSTLTNPQAQKTQYEYDAVGNVVKVTGANGIITTQAYNGRNQVTAIITKTSAGALLASSVSTYDNLGLLTSITQENGDKTTYAYDQLHRLLNETKKNTSGTVLYSYVYTYDALGNRLTMNKNGVLTSYTYNDLNQLTQTVSNTGTNTYTYNNNGNLIKTIEAGSTTNYEYDYDNHLTKIIYPDATTSLFVYRADGTRVKTTEGSVVTNYLYDGQLPVIERNGSNVTQNTYTNGLGFGGGIGGLISQMSLGVTTWYHYVHNGPTNVSHITNSSGAVVKTYNYEAFGNIVSQSGSATNTRQFQTKETNSKSKLVYFGQRWYNPVIGRWTTPDPLGMVDGPNLYAYLNNNPINNVDAWGLCGGLGKAFADFFFDSTTFSESRKLFQASSGPNGDLGLQALAIVGMVALPFDALFNVASLGEKAVVQNGAKNVGKFVLGHAPDYIKVGQKLGAKVFSVPSNIWDKMTDAARWGANQKSIDRALNKGDQLIFSNNPFTARPGSTFEREVGYLRGKGVDIGSIPLVRP